MSLKVRQRGADAVQSTFPFPSTVTASLWLSVCGVFMADLLSTGVSGLLAFQRALDTTSHNIANVSTPGYSRQLVDMTTRQANQTGNGWVGNGVDVSTVKRMYDDFLASQTRSSSSTYQQLNTYATQVGRINNLLGDSKTGLSATLQNFINAVQAVSDTPTSIPARQTLLSQAQALVTRLQGYDASLDSFEAQVNSNLESEANSISTLAQGIATLNQKISGGSAQTGQPPNDLLDQRDRLLDELADPRQCERREAGRQLGQRLHW